VLSGGEEVDVQHLPSTITDDGGSGGLGAVAPAAVRPLSIALREFELQYLRRALKAADNKRTRAAEMLGISRKTLWEKLRNVGVTSDPDFDGDDETPSVADAG